MVSHQKWIVVVASAAIMMVVLIAAFMWPTPAENAALKPYDIGFDGWKQDQTSKELPYRYPGTTSYFNSVMEGPVPDGYMFVSFEIYIFNSSTSANISYYDWCLGSYRTDNSFYNSSLWDDGSLGGWPGAPLYELLCARFVEGNAVVGMIICPLSGGEMALENQILWTERIAEMQSAKLISCGVVHY
jgi:hypothetical protein